MRVKDAVGRFGEDVAATRLQSAGFVVLARNWRTRTGELDLVARDGDELVFVEVKTRSSTRFGTPAEAVDRAKAARIRRLALEWLADTRSGERFWRSVRFDVVEVVRADAGGLTVRHLRGAF